MRRLHIAVLAVGLCLLHLAGLAQAQTQPQPQAGRRLILSLVPPEKIEAPPPIPVLAERAVSALTEECVGTRHGPESLGDLLPIRQVTMIPALDPHIRRSLAVAYISQSASVAEELLSPLRANPAPAVGYLATLVSLHVRLRAGGQTPTEAELDQLHKLGETAALPTSDVEYFRALSRLHAGDLQRARDAAELALKQEPLYFNATMALLEIDLKAYRSAADTLPKCRAALLNVVDTLRRMTDLSPCPLQAIFVDTYLGGGIVDDGEPGARLARAYLAVLSRKPRVATHRLQTLKRDLEAASERTACAGEIRTQVDRMLQLPPIETKR